MASETLTFDLYWNDRGASSGMLRTGAGMDELGKQASGAADEVRSLKDKVEALKDKSAKARVGVDGSKEAAAELDKLDVKLIKLGDKVANPSIDMGGKVRALADIAAVDVAMDRLNKKVARPSLLTKAAGASALAPSLLGSAVALSPSLIPLAAGLAAGVGAIAVSFGAAAAGAGVFGLAAASVLSDASQNLTKLQALYANLDKATTAAQKKTAQAAIGALKSTFAPGYMALLDQLDKFKGAWTKTSQTIAVPALTSWLGALTKGMPLLVTAVKPVADVFKNFGDILAADFSNPAVMRNLQGMAAAFGKFAAGQLNLIGRAIGDIALGVYHLGQDFADSGANFASAGVWFANMGTAFLNWSKSKKARDDVDGFLKYLHDNGPTVKNILKDLRDILPGIFKGATTTGTLELQAISGFLSLVAKLPKGWQAPLTEAAGAMLLLSKTGVVKVGLKMTGWAMAGQAAGGAAQGAATGGTLAALQRSTGLKWAFRAGLAVAIAELIVKPALQSTPSGKGKNWWDNPFGTDKGKGALNSWSDLWHDIEHIFDTGRHFIAHSWDMVWNNTVGRLERGRHDIAAEFDTWRHNTSAVFDNVRHGIARTWDQIWNNTVARVRGGIGDVVDWFSKLPGRAVNALEGLGTSLYNFAHMAMTKLWNGLKSVFDDVWGWFKSLPGKLLNAIGIHSPPDWAIQAGKHIMGGLLHGITSRKNELQGAFRGATSGALGGDALANQALARKIFPWPASQWPPFVSLEMGEAGFDRFAQNKSSGAYGIPQALPPTKMPFAAQAAGGSHAGPQLSWMFNYIATTYGTPANAYSMWLSRSPHWYGTGLAGGIFRSPTLIGVGERGPEMVSVTPAGRGGPGTVINLNVAVGHGTHPVAAAQEIVKLLNAGAMTGVKLRSSILGPG